MRILITNDDGVSAAGIHALVDVFKTDHEVIMIAPDDERSGFSHSVTIFKPISYTRVSGLEILPVKNANDYSASHVDASNINSNVEAYAVSGTPADCVKLGVLHILKERPIDLVISGINSGPNLGGDIMYSGTVGAANEGVFLGVPAIAISLGFWTKKSDYYKDVAEYLKSNLDILYKLAKENQSKVLLNINYPIKKAYKGTVFVKAGVNNSYDDYFDFCEEKQGTITMQLKGDIVKFNDENNKCDVDYIQEGYATVTPIKLDRTHHELVEQYNKEIKLR